MTIHITSSKRRLLDCQPTEVQPEPLTKKYNRVNTPSESENFFDKIYLKEGMTNSGVALDSDGKSEVDAPCETHLSHWQEEGHLQISDLLHQ